MWIYNSRTPWLYYIRQIDLEIDSCSLAWEDLDEKVNPIAGQKIYTEMSKLIRDLALKRKIEENIIRAVQLLSQVSENKFEYAKSNPMALFHNDLTAKKPAYFWSKTVPYALWLRLYYEVHNRTEKSN